MPRWQVDHQILVRLAGVLVDQPPLEDRLQRFAQVALVWPVVAVELRIHHFAVVVESGLRGDDFAVRDALRIDQFPYILQVAHVNRPPFAFLGLSDALERR